MKKKVIRKLQRLRFKINDRSIKITAEGQECRQCDGKVQKCTHKPGWKPRPSQPFYFSYWFKCQKCKALYMVEDAKIHLRVSTQDEISRAFDYAVSKGEL